MMLAAFAKRNGCTCTMQYVLTYAKSPSYKCDQTDLYTFQYEHCPTDLAASSISTLVNTPTMYHLRNKKASPMATI